jgi:hypothetical protein
MNKIWAALRGKVSGLEDALIALVMLASFASVYYSSTQLSKPGVTMWISVAIGIAAVGYLVVASGKACHAWHQRRLGALVFNLMLLGAAFAWETKAHMSTASLNEEGVSIKQAAKSQTHSSAKDAVNEAAAKVSGLRKSRDDLQASAYEAKPKIGDRIVASSVEADAHIKMSKAHRFWKMTDECTSTGGKATSAFCREYAEAVGALSAISVNEGRLVKLGKASEALAIAELELKEARASLGTTDVAVSGDRSDTKNMTKVAGWLGFSSYDAELANATLMLMVMSLFLIIAKWGRTAEEYAGVDLPSWIDWSRWHSVFIKGEWTPKARTGPGGVAVTLEDNRHLQSALSDALKGYKPN